MTLKKTTIKKYIKKIKKSDTKAEERDQKLSKWNTAHTKMKVNFPCYQWAKFIEFEHSMLWYVISDEQVWSLKKWWTVFGFWKIHAEFGRGSLLSFLSSDHHFYTLLIACSDDALVALMFQEFCSTSWSQLETWYKQKLYPKADDHRFKWVKTAAMCFMSSPHPPHSC